MMRATVFVIGGLLAMSSVRADVALEVQAAQTADQPEPRIQAFIDLLFEDEATFQSIPFAQVIYATSGHRVEPLLKDDPVDQEALQALSNSIASVLETFKDPEHAIHSVGRVNEISRWVEDALIKELNRGDAFEAAIPLNAAGRVQRSGYPDIRLKHSASSRVYYIDPKVYKEGSERSSFRTFYFEPKRETNKILEDARHLIVGLSHAGKIDGIWTFKTWKIVDLAHFEVSLKAEFQASNRDLYREALIVEESGAEAQ